MKQLAERTKRSYSGC